MTAPLPFNEHDRLAALRQLDILDTPFEESFDRVTRLAGHLFDIPIALVSLVDEKRQWFKSCYNFPHRETGREVSFCAHALLSDGVMVVPDATQDPRFAENPLVTEAPGIRFYAGAQLKTAAGFTVGTLCIIDTRPREFSAEDNARLHDLATIIADELELRYASTVRKELVQRLEGALARIKEVEALRDSLTHMLIHDLRNPLSATVGFLQVLRMSVEKKLTAAELRYITIAEQGAETLNGMITSLLDVNRMEAGEMPLDLRVRDLREIVSAATEAARGASDLHVSVEVPSEPVTALADGNIIHRVICNLVSNALKFTSKGQEIRVVLQRDALQASVAVIDQGPGIPPEFQAKIFEKFGQVNGRRHVHSTGLGLTFCKLGIEAHGGTISVASVPGAGSTFTFRLPAVHEA